MAPIPYTDLVDRVVGSLSDDLRRAPWKGRSGLAGYCYIVAEALFHLLGGRRSGWTPQFIRHEGGPHWYLRKGSCILDPTVSQFSSPPDYTLGKGKGFLTLAPSKRAQIVIDRANSV